MGAIKQRYLPVYSERSIDDSNFPEWLYDTFVEERSSEKFYDQGYRFQYQVVPGIKLTNSRRLRLFLEDCKTAKEKLLADAERGGYKVIFGKITLER